ncbi:WbqC family protein [Candidatus Moduliflexota bacterium]
MIVCAAQPYFAPYPGFFAKALLSDVLVLLDSVQFPQRTTWMTRNRFKNEQGALWMTIPVQRKGRSFQKIGEVRLAREGSWARKHLKSLRSAYGRAPFFEEHHGFLEDLFSSPAELLLDFNVTVIRHICTGLGMSPRIVLLSELGVSAKEPELTVHICRALGAKVFLAQVPAAKFLDGEALHGAGVGLRLIALHPPIYPQLYGPFITNLSAFDLLFTCGPKALDIIRKSVRSEGLLMSEEAP